MYQFELLEKLGLSKIACRCYGALVTDGPLTGEELAKQLNLTVNGLYRVLKKLEDMGFVKSVKPYGHSRRYRAYSVNKAMNNYFEYQKQLIKPLSRRFPPVPSKDLMISRLIKKQLDN